MCILEN
jgi:hypothetical protein